MVWLSPQQQPQLFHHVLGGLGQFGVVTRVKLRLRPAATRAGAGKSGYTPRGLPLQGGGRFMTRYVMGRLLESLVVLIIMSLVIYGLMSLMPGDPIYHGASRPRPHTC